MLPLSKSSDSRTWQTVNPDASKPVVTKLPEVTDLNIPDATAGVSVSTPFSTRDNYEELKTAERDAAQARLDKLAGAKETKIDEKFDPKIEGAEEYREDITRSTKGKYATERRLSTAALTFVDERRGNAQKQVNYLESQKAIAEANLDVEMADRLDKEMANWQENERYWANQDEIIKQQDFENTFKLRGEERDVAREDREIQEEELQKQKDDFMSLVDLGYDFENLSPNQKTDFGEMFGITGEASESVFKSIKDAQEAQKVNDEVAKMKGIYDFLTMVPEGESVTIGDETYTGMKSGNENILNYEKIVGGVKYMIGYNKKTGKNDYELNMGSAYKPTAGRTISLSEAIALGKPELAGRPYSAIPEGIDVPDEDEAKQFARYEKESSDFRGQLDADLISWEYAYNYLRGKYSIPEPKEGEENILDEVLGKKENYKKTGAGTKGGRDEAMLKVGG